MKIYTGNGDQGTSNLFSGRSLPKNHHIFEAMGNVDELNSFVGQLIVKVNDETVFNFLKHLQHLLFFVGSKIAVDGVAIDLGTFSEKTCTLVETEIDRMTEELSPLTKFILPGGSETVAAAHICRTVCRRAERSLVGIEGIGAFELVFFNRLSDYFFVLGRYLLHKEGLTEIYWDKNAIQ
ncbi:MAG: cob(I)yrinic acid a,c-diamide adenosyltransferase [Saprospiraceae bacterium]|nr:cob(I)yrinic acid a,c-diamide adenosyltransferase [Saprospiraceae bacterium]MBK8632816.1 cob(I)yrinic acid a,c-diamide adenosyltransferase [Saprospiraceae bacterium]MBP7643854.1 cob(I)yrinic acid a,c-diamide adenosyltransferase [Saprospiraceae bacterium]